MLNLRFGTQRPMIKAVLLDIDGTLLDSVDFHARSWEETFLRHGVRVPFHDVREQIGKGGDKLMAVFLSEEQIKREGKRIEKERGDLFRREYLPKVKPFPAIHELFERFKSEGINMALASSAKAEELEAYKRILGIEPYLEAETSSDDVSGSKPDPDIFLEALKGLDTVKPHEAIAVGDTPYDAEAAGKGGISSIGLLCGGFDAEKLGGAGCMALYRDPADLLAKFDDSVFSRAYAK